MPRDIKFSRRLLQWFARHGRHDLPWQKRVTLYRIWVSEIMLQQTQVSTVIPYFKVFIRRFPDVHALAAADLDEVLHYWSGLGYYARARNLHRAARMVVDNHKGQLPAEIDSLLKLPGIGRSTAGAILALAGGQSHPILDGNVKRVLARYHGIHGWPGLSAVGRELWQRAEDHTPHKNAGHYTQAIMDLGATLCIRGNPACGKCPVKQGCYAYRHSLQHEFPGPKPVKKLPVRKTVFAVLENHRGEMLLEQRPPAGIWGGLWSFPECAPDEDIAGWIKKRWGYAVNTLEYKAPVRHSFSHFHLDIVPVHARVKINGRRVSDDSRYCWYPQSGRNNVGMPTPVQRLLRELSNKKRD